MFSDDAELVALFGIDEVEGEHKPTFNQAPKQLIRSIHQLPDEQRQLGLAQWGLVPSWAKEGFKPLINARSESVTSKPAFRSSVTRRRCLVPTNGYFEWQKRPEKKKQPYFISLADADGNAAPVGSEPILAMAGIFEWPQEKREAPTVSLLTRKAEGSMAKIHDRQPLFLPVGLWGEWMNPELQNKDEVQELIASALAPPLVARKVGAAVGNVRNDFPGLIENLEENKDTGQLELPWE